MIPPYTYAAARLAEERTKDTLRQGELAHLLRHAKPARFGPMDRLAARLGGLLTAAGGRLRERCDLFWNTTGACTWQPTASQRR